MQEILERDHWDRIAQIKYCQPCILKIGVELVMSARVDVLHDGW